MNRAGTRLSPAVHSDGNLAMPPRQDSDEIMSRAERESTSLGSSALARAADHLTAKDAPPEDRIELWGRRIGRGLSMIAAIWLAAWLFGWLSR
jgi:hypothetical protein